MILKCNEAVSICDKSQYKESNTFDKFKLSLHNVLCDKCRCYSKQNKFITKILKTYTGQSHKHDLPAKDKEILKTTLDKEIIKNHTS